MEIPDQLRTLISVPVEEREDSFVVEVPEQEIRLGDLQVGETYRVAVLPSPVTNEDDDTVSNSQPEQGPQTPPIEEEETRTVGIEDLGEQGDGIACVGRGFVMIVPNTRQGERVINLILTA